MRWILMALVAATFAGPVMAQETAEKKEKKEKRRADVIALWEIDQIRGEVTNAHEIVVRLRSQFLRVRGVSTIHGDPPTIKVIVDGYPRGDVGTLVQIPAISIKEIRYLKAGDATTQFGTGYDAGAIVVKTQ